MIQNHLLQILCLIAMEAPVSFDSDEIRQKKVDVIRAIRTIPPEQVHLNAVRGQYGAGWIEGEHVQGYRSEPGVAPDSPTDTYAAVKLFVDNWRWQDVPFYLRTGKRLPARISEVSIQFRPVPHQTFPASALLDSRPNRLLIAIQPEEGILLRFEVKHPGQHMALAPVMMQFYYREAFKVRSPEAYETLLLDIMRGDSTLFMRADQTEACMGGDCPDPGDVAIGKTYRFPRLPGRDLGAGSSRYIHRAGRTKLDGPHLSSMPGGPCYMPGCKRDSAIVRAYPGHEALSRAAAELFVRLANEAISERGRFSVALSGGHTPQRAYELMAGPQFNNLLDWDRVHLFWADERCVPPNDPRSNALMVREKLLDHVPVPPGTCASDCLCG